jgi:hypothetical protein
LDIANTVRIKKRQERDIKFPHPNPQVTASCTNFDQNMIHATDLNSTVVQLKPLSSPVASVLA